MERLLCSRCGRHGRLHPAFFVEAGRSLCVRHFVDLLHPDDMCAHDLAQVLYDRLRDLGVTDPY